MNAHPLSKPARSRNRGFAASALLALATSSLLPAIELAKWDFTGTAGNEVSLPANSTASGVTASTLTRGTGISASAAGGSFSATGWTLSTSVDANDYFQFTLTIDSSTTTNIDSISFAERRSGTGVRQFVLRSSLDSFATDTVAAVSVPDDTATRSHTLVLPAAFDNLTNTAVTFRIYGYEAEASGGTWRLANHSVLGGLVIENEITPPDTTPPGVATYSPTVGATNVAVATNLVLTFDEPVTKLTGDIEIKDGTNTITIPVTDSAQVTVSGTTVTINPTADLELSTAYHVLIDPGTFEDAAGNDFLGITSDTTWTFTTIGPDTTGPAVVSVIPTNGANNVDIAVNPVINFDENIFAGTGNILIKRVSDGSTVSTLSVTNTSQVLVFNNQAFLTPPDPLPIATSFYIEVPLGAFEDALGNDSAAFGGNGVWNFTTPVMAVLTSSGPYTQSFTGFSVASPVLPDGWTLSGPVTGFNEGGGNEVIWGLGTGSGLRGGADLLGFQHTGSTGTLVKTLTLQNATGATITDLTVSYIGRAARTSELRKPAYTVSVAGNTASTLAYSTADGDNQTRSAGITGLSIPAGASFTITWASNANVGTTGSRTQIGVDEVSVSVGIQTFPPSVGSVSVDYDSLGQSGVFVSSEVTSDGGTALTAAGFVIAPALSNPSPEIGGVDVTNVPSTAAVGALTETLSGLLPDTYYALRSYATNSQGTSYSIVSEFYTLKTIPSFVDEFTQSFDGFAGSIATGGLPAGWKVLSSGGVNGYAGVWGPATQTGGVLGGAASPGLLGYQHVSASGIATVTLSLKNDTGNSINSLYVSYYGRAERVEEPRIIAWTVSVDGTPVTDLDFATSTTDYTQRAKLVTGLSIAPGATFNITWASDGNVGSNGARRQIGISDVFVGLEAPPAGGYTDWATTNVGGDPADADTDGDGVPNGVEYFMGETGSTFTANPSPDATGTVTWVRDPNATGVTFKVRTSPDLQTWTDVELTDPALTVTTTSVSYALPTATTGPLFVRLEVTVPAP